MATEVMDLLLKTASPREVTSAFHSMSNLIERVQAQVGRLAGRSAACTPPSRAPPRQGSTIPPYRPCENAADQAVLPRLASSTFLARECGDLSN
jgi:hypothetical protein